MKIYNTLTRKKETFTTLTDGVVKMYTCGQTVYNDIHIGNARFYVIFDAIRRYLTYKGYAVQFVQNFTDIDDKIIAKANAEGVSSQEISARYIARTLEDLAKLNISPATVNPLVSAEMPEIIAMISELIDKGFAYESGGTVYFGVPAFEPYGKLSKKPIDDLEAGARVEVAAEKHNPADFVLWKPAKANEPHWESPWGNGRPGWHIECSAMVRKYLGDQIDIHGGGADLIFPHHENEIAQSEALTGHEYSRYWMHCGLLTSAHKKMSKSSGNFFTLRELAEKYPFEVIRFYFLSGHYRMPMEFTEAVIGASQAGFLRIRKCFNNLTHLINTPNTNMSPVSASEAGTKAAMMPSKNTASAQDETRPFHDAFFAAMDDDFNTADAISAIFDLVKHINIQTASIDTHSVAYLIRLKEILTSLTDILGIQLGDHRAGIRSHKGYIPEDYLIGTKASPESASAIEDNTAIEALIQVRQDARKNKDFTEADRIRNQLTAMGIVLEDTRGGVRWHRA